MLPAHLAVHSACRRQCFENFDQLTLLSFHPRFYMTCFQINVTGGGSASPAGVSFPGAYSASDPGILINIYSQLNSYVSKYCHFLHVHEHVPDFWDVSPWPSTLRNYLAERRRNRLAIKGHMEHCRPTRDCSSHLPRRICSAAHNFDSVRTCE